MFYNKKNKEQKKQTYALKFLFEIQNELIKFNWKTMDDFKNTKNLEYVEVMNHVQDAINSLNKAQLNFSKTFNDDKNVVSINKNQSKKSI
tara:strand:- start:15 stop:284 length:270 start_codon:yes stop_codon:yes gene_type:complete